MFREIPQTVKIELENDGNTTICGKWAVGVAIFLFNTYICTR